MRCLPALVVLLLSLPVVAAIDIYQFETPEQESQFRALVEELRCPKCLNTNLSGSDAPIAADLRQSVARMVVAGHTDQEIRDYHRERYGDFILYRPRLTSRTWLLWFGPALLLCMGGLVVLVVARRARVEVGPRPVGAEEQARLAVLRAQAAASDPDSR